MLPLPLKIGMVHFLTTFPREAAIWLAALGVLAVVETDAHFSLCPLQKLGFAFCPGCGLGRSVSLLFRGEWSASFQMHPLGLFAVIALSFRTYQLIHQFIRDYGKRHRCTS